MNDRLSIDVRPLTDARLGDYLRFFDHALRWKPALDLADRVGAELAAMGVTTASPSLANIGKQIAEIGIAP